jgi:shikimate dehydrogenase
MLDAEKLGIKTVNGLSMLVSQAAKAFEYFTGDEAEWSEVESITDSISKKCKNIVLVGMPGCGKSTVGKLIAECLGRSFYDADDEFFKMHGITPADCIESLGEPRFRELESITLRELGKLGGAVIATGGGAVTREENYEPLHQNGEIFFIERELGHLSRDGRPLSLASTPEELYKARIKHYLRFADAVVHSNEIAEETARKIIDIYLR